ncbi:MAG: carboxymuconolactone decarboxylase family protein [Candidatus Binatia bacterium]
MDIGSAVGRKVGVTEAQLFDLARYQESPAFSPLERLVIEYSEAMTKTPVEVPDTLFAALRRHFNEAQLVELTATIAWENYRARFDHAFGIEAQGFSAGAFCVVPERPAEASAINGKNLGSTAA